MKNFRRLKVWENAHGLTLDVYQASDWFPREELYGLTSQIRRSSVSIPTNIAEGCGRKSEKEFARFLEIAMGSASETEYLLLLIRDLEILDDHDYGRLNNAVVEIKQMLASLINRIRSEN